jgi:ATP-dependent Lon protease
VNRRIRLGKAVEGRDEKGIKKTVAAFLKILHPNGAPSDEEFDEYVSYAVECRRRVKEQMNKRKPDDEFALINLSYFISNGTEVVVYCPESKDAAATQEPTRRRLNVSKQTEAQPEEITTSTNRVPEVSNSQTPSALRETSTSRRETREQHFTIMYGDTGHSYESIIGPYLLGAKAVLIEDPYIRLPHQIQNFVRFCETVVKAGTVKKIELVTGYDDRTELAEIHEKLNDLKQSLLEVDLILDVKLNANIHDREIRLDNGWVIKIGRGLDFYQRPSSWFEIGANDLSLRKCLETKVDIYNLNESNS